MTGSKYLKLGYAAVFLAMLIHVFVGAGQFAASFDPMLGWLGLTNVLYYVPALALLEIIRLCCRFRRQESTPRKISAAVLIVTHILCFVFFLVLNAHQLHTLSSYGCILLFGSLFTTCAFYPVCIIAAYCIDGILRVSSRQSKPFGIDPPRA